MMDTGQHTDVETPPDSNNRNPVILLLIQNSKDQRLFKENLPDDFAVITGEKRLEPGEFDLCIVDDKTSRLHRETLESLKKQTRPVSLPVLLLSQNQDILKKYPDMLEFADDVVQIPTSTKLLRSRIKILLTQRNYSLKLEKKNRQLEMINELKDQMLGMAAHDLRNPLTLTQNYALFLIEDHKEQHIFTEDQFQLVREIKESSEYMVRIVEDMLDISALESGSVNLEKSDINLGKFIERIVTLNQPKATKKDISIITNLPDTPVLKEIDAHKFQQVLDNLVSNAIKYSQRGTEVDVGIREESEGAITIYVEDEGQGIPEEERDDLFVPFSKISVEATAGEKSTGLGLAIALKIADAHGGDIQVESKVGVGSTFFVHLP